MLQWNHALCCDVWYRIVLIRIRSNSFGIFPPWNRTFWNILSQKVPLLRRLPRMLLTGLVVNPRPFGCQSAALKWLGAARSKRPYAAKTFWLNLSNSSNSLPTEIDGDLFAGGHRSNRQLASRTDRPYGRTKKRTRAVATNTKFWETIQKHATWIFFRLYCLLFAQCKCITGISYSTWHDGIS